MERTTQSDIEVKIALLAVAKNLDKNMEKLNDEFILHRKRTEQPQVETLKVVKESHTLLIRYLKWAIVAIIVLLGGERIYELLLKFV